MKMAEMISTTPIGVEKSVRGEEIRVLTSCAAGKIVPVAFIPLLREDRLTSGRLRISLDMAETIHPLMNSVNVTAYVHFVPWLAFERFNGEMTALNRSYQGVPEAHNDTVIPYFHQMTYFRNAPIWRKMGVHWKQGMPINSAPVEAYNAIVNFRRKARSRHLPLRTAFDDTLAEAFWRHPNMSHIVPDFDDASMEGEVPLEVVNPLIPVIGFGRAAAGSVTPQTNGAVVENLATGPDNAETYPYFLSPGNSNIRLRTDGTGIPEVFAEMQASGLKISLANIELAKRTAAFAKLRRNYSGLDDEHIIDLLMEGIRVPDESLKQPILLDRKSTVFGYSERHAMDGASLDVSVTTGSTSLDLVYRTPAMNVGGVIMVTLEIVPDALFERMYDTFLGTTDPAQLPNFLRDYIDAQKVSIVQNQFVDVEHSNPTGMFGYAPLNHQWKRSFTRIGGKYHRQNPDTWVEDRQRFWSVEQLNPALTSDFYLVNNLPHTVFLDTISDPFEVLAIGSNSIVGNTVFGRGLEEDTDDYNKIMQQVDLTRIDGEGE